MKEYFELFQKLDISYEIYNHEAVYTSKEADLISKNFHGIGCKNLFLKDKEKHYYLVLIDSKKKGDLKFYEKLLSCSHLSFASEEELKEILHVSRGSITPLALLFDTGNIKVLIDSCFQNQFILMHFLTNTKTISISCASLLKLLNHFKNPYVFFE